ncbi:DUF927 domain-containing protein [Caballeronia grimmiae]|uniref:DUF927 domain-containing protein n=1 Tax=Caballeronia grimmiae TaxID=1071679 RepID=UPI0038B9A036
MSAIVDEQQRIETALLCIPPDIPREEWARVGAALKDEMGDAGFDLFDRWSQGAGNYEAAAARDTWRSLKPGMIRIGTLFHVASEHGFDLRAHKAAPVDPAELDRRRAERQKRDATDAAKRERQAKHAATIALAIWEKATEAHDDHPYLMRKGLSAPKTLREIDATKLAKLAGYVPNANGTPLEGRLLVAPVGDGERITTLELIDSYGRKSALAGGAKSGLWWSAVPFHRDAQRVLIGEGIATVLSAHVATGDLAVAALSCGNLKKVAQNMREKLPDAEIVVLADLGNGEADAMKAAEAVGGSLAAPDFGDDRADEETDFNDLHMKVGVDAVSAAIEAARAAQSEAPQHADKQASKRSGRSADGCVPAGFNVTDRGVFYEEDDGTPHWICSPLHVRALVRDRASENWGRLLEWTDADGHPHVWAMPMEMLRSDGADMRGELARLGLDIAPGSKARNKLTEYVTTAKPKARGRCVTRTGWHAGAFVFPDQTIGASDERVIFQSEAVVRTYSTSGSLRDWMDTVARVCSGNSRLLLAVSTAFAGMLLSYSGQESGGLNLVGDSSCGKTTALRAACSVFGGPEYMQRWRATSNGLEGLAALHNDTLLVLDELAQVDPREAGEIAYMLANGSGKARAGRTGAARARQTWRLLFLSAGEIGLAQHMQAGGKKAKAGQEVRLVEIPADAGAGFGLFETLHGMAGGAQLSSTITDACSKHYGTAAIAFLSALTDESNPETIGEWLKQQTAVFLREHLPADANGQAHRVCQRFALIGLAGEYATNVGITGWKDGEALEAAAKCFAAWVENRGGAGNHEKTSILSHVKAFFESHEESRFTDLSDASDRPTINRAGFRRSGENGTEYLVLPEVFKREVCSGFEPKAAGRMLVDAGWVRPAPDGKFQRSERIPGKGTVRVYVFTPALWESNV